MQQNSRIVPQFQNGNSLDSEPLHVVEPSAFANLFDNEQPAPNKENSNADEENAEEEIEDSSSGGK